MKNYVRTHEIIHPSVVGTSLVGQAADKQELQRADNYNYEPQPREDTVNEENEEPTAVQTDEIPIDESSETVTDNEIAIEGRALRRSQRKRLPCQRYKHYALFTDQKERKLQSESPWCCKLH